MNDATRIGRHHHWRRKLLILGSILLVIVIAAAIAIPRLLDVNTYRATIAEQISRRLGRPVSLGQIELTVLPLPTATIHDIAVAGQGIEGRNALIAPTLRARCRLIPMLFSRQIELAELTIDRPEIVLIRGASGRWNWQDMLEAGGSGSSPGPRSEAWKDEQLGITDGTIRVIDEFAEPGRTLRFTLSPLDLALHRRGTGRPVDLDLHGALTAEDGSRQGAPDRGSFGFKGQVGPLPAPFAGSQLALDGVLTADRFPLQAILPYIQSDQGVRALRGALTADFRITMRPQSTIEAKGELKLDRVYYELFGPPARSGTLDLASELDLSIANERRSFDIRKLDLIFPEGRLAVTGEVSAEPPGTRLALQVDGSGLRSAGLESVANLIGIELPVTGLGTQPFDVQGKIERRALPNGGARLVLRDLRVRGIAASFARNPAESWSLGASVPPARPTPPTQLTVEGLHVERSAITITDAKAGRSVPLRLSDVELELDRFGTGQASHGRVEATLAGGGRLDVQGTLGPEANAERAIDARIRLDDAPVAALQPYVSGVINAGSAQGTVDLDASVRGPSLRRLAAKGTLGLRDVQIDRPSQAGRTSLQELTADVAFDAILEDGGQLMRFNSCRVSLPSGAFTFSGTLDRRSGSSTADITVPATRLKAEDLQALASLAGISLPGAIRSPDPISVSVRARGDLADLRRLNLAGSLQAAHLTWEAPFLRRPLENVAATVQFTGDGLETKGFSATLAGMTMQGDLALRNFGAPEITFALRSDRVDLGQLLSEWSGPTGQAPATSGSAGAQKGKFTGHGTVFIQSGSFNTLTFSELNSTVTVQGPTIRLAPLSFGLYGGKYSGESTVDLRGHTPLFKHNCTLTALDANALLSATTPLKDVLHGTLSGHLAADGTGKSMDEVVRSLNGSGEFTVSNGALTGSSMLKGLSDVAGLFGERTLSQISQRMTTDQTPFSRLSASFRVAGGQLATDDLRLDSNDFTLTADGRAGLDRRLGFDGRIVFSDAISRSLREEGSRAVYLGAEAGRVAVPVTVAGTIDRPSFAVDFGSAAGYAVTKTITDRLAEQLRRRETAPKTPPKASSSDTARSRVAGQRADTSSAPAKVDSKTPPQTTPPPAKEAQEAKEAQTPPPAPAPKPAPADLEVRVESHQFRGQPQRPDLAVTGTVVGRHLAALLIVVSDEKGRVAHQEARLAPEIASAYKGRNRSDRITVPFSIRVSGARLPPSTKAINMTLLAVSESGAKSPPVSIVERSRL